MNLEKYNEALRNWIPEDEEQNMDQQRAIQATMRMRYLRIPTIVADDVYERMRNEIAESLDLDQLIQFENDYISQSEYDAQYNELADIIEEIDKKYGIMQEQNETEYTEEVNKKRNDLKALKEYYLSNDNYTMRNVDVELLGSDEVLNLYQQIVAGIGSEKFNELVTNGYNIISERERNERLDPIRRRVAGRTVPTPISNPEPENTLNEEEQYAEIEKNIANFKNNVDKIKSDLEQINGKLILGDTEGIEVNDIVNEINEEVNNLSNESQQLISQIDDFKIRWENADFSIDYKQIQKELKVIKNNLRRLKQEQVRQYNIKVDATNAVIDELRALNNSDINAKLDALPELQKCNVNITRWNMPMKYLDSIDYDKLVEVNNSLSEIRDIENEHSLNGNIDNMDWFIMMNDLDKDISDIEDKINVINDEIVDILPLEDINRLRQDINICSSDILSFRNKLENNKDKIDEDDYNKLVDRFETAIEYLSDLNMDLNQKSMYSAEIDPDKSKIYDELMREVNYLKGSLDNFDFSVNSVFGKINSENAKAYLDILNRNKQSLEDLDKDIEEKNKLGKLDSNQYNNLKNEVSQLNDIIEQININLKKPDMVKDADVYSIINDNIDVLEEKLAGIEDIVNKASKRLDKDDRKNIDSIVKYIEKEIKRLENLVEEYKDKDPEKYNNTVNRINELKNSMDKFGKNYRSKCPLMVKSVKSAKNFFSKHRKQVLIIAGLATFAIVAHQVLIPAIMHGNIMIAYSSSALRPFIKFCDKILGGIIGATLDAEGIWTLASGVVINPSVAATSLLKGLAISGVGSTALIAPVIIAIKKLIEKMKTAELKQRLTEDLGVVKEKVSSKIKSGKDKVSEGIGKVKNSYSDRVADRIAKKDIKMLLKDYRNSGMSIEEYAEEEELTDEEIAMLRYFDESSNEYRNSVRKVR